MVMFALRQLKQKTMNSVTGVHQNGTQARANLLVVKMETHRHNLYEIIRLLCEAGGNINGRCGPHSVSAMHEACHLPSFHVFDILSNLGGDISRPDLCLRNVMHHFVAFYGLPFECNVPERLQNIDAMLMRLREADGVSLRKMTNDFDHIGLSPFMILCRYPEPRNARNRENYAVAIDAMLAAGARPNVRATRKAIRQRMSVLCRAKHLPYVYAVFVFKHGFPLLSAVEWAQRRNNHTLVCYLTVREAARGELDLYLPVDLSREVLAFAYSYQTFGMRVSGFQK